MSTKSLITVDECKSLVLQWKEGGETIALVPTMGALHEGHISLISKAKEIADKVIVSIFVNPAQFGPSEDFALYPRTPSKDMQVLQAQDVDAVFSPTANEMYEPFFQTWVSNDNIADSLCGKSRPGHFRGVCTVVMKLINITRADFSLFGKKDYQQVKVVENMVDDLNLNTQVVGCETLRSDMGLALSSRNKRLTPAEFEIAPTLFVGLNKILKSYSEGTRDCEKLIQLFNQEISQYSEIELEYIEIRKVDNFELFSEVIDSDAVVLIAARLGSVRLIDSMELRV